MSEKPRPLVAIEGGTPAVRAGLAALLAELGGFHVSLELPSKARPDVILAVGAAGRSPHDDVPRVIMVETPADAATLANRTGFAGALLSDADGEQLTAAINAVMAGLIVLAPGVALGTSATTAAGPPAAKGELTPREAEVLALIADGLANKAIALRLGISENTVKFHAAAVLGKLGTSSRAEAVMAAARRGLLAL